MSTTAEKLTYLNTTKGKIKDSINLTGAGITTEPFRQYAVKLKDAYVDIINNGTDTLYNNFPKVSATGESMELSNTYEAPMQIDLKGNTSQVQLSGKNLLGLSNFVSITTDSGITLSNDATTGKVTLNGTTIRNTFITYSTKTFNVNDIVSLSANNSTINGDVAIRLYNITTGGTTPNVNFDAINKISENITLSNVFDGFQIRIASGTTLNNYVLYPQIEKNITATDFEVYCGGTPSPNPSYPQDINVVSGNNTITICGKNLFDKDTIIIYSGYFNASGVISAKSIDENSDKWFYIPCKPNTTYTITKPITPTQSMNRFRVGTTTNIPEANDTLNDFWRMSDGGDTTIKTITTSANANYLCIYYGKGDSNTDHIQSVLNGIQIEQGNQSTTYEAYNGTTYPINLPVENLFDGELELGNFDGSGNKAIADNLYRCKNIIHCQPNTTYTFSIDGVSQKYCLYYYDSSKTYISNNLNLTTGTFTTPNNCFYLNFRCFSADFTSDFANLDVQLEQGSKANSYTPYGTTPIELNKIGTYEDNFLRNSGKNLFDKDNANVINGYINTSGSITAYESDRTIWIPCEPNTTYTIHKMLDTTSANNRFRVITTSTTPTNNSQCIDFIRYDNGTQVQNITLTTSVNAHYLAIFCYTNGTTTSFDDMKNSIMINYGNETLPYEPYGSGKWYLHKEIGKVVLNGSESYTSMGYSSNRYAYRTTITNLKQTTNQSDTSLLLANYYYAISQSGITGENGNGRIANRVNQSDIIIRNDSCTSTTDFKTWLSTHNVIVDYVLATPTNTEITDTTLLSQLEAIYNAKSKNGTTNINQENNDLPFIITASALEKEV